MARTNRDIVVIGASAGGVDALIQVVSKLPADFPGVLLIVLHVPALGTSLLPDILRRAGSLPCAHAVDGDTILPGHVYVAPPDSHLLLRGSLIRLSRGPRENGHRPAVDPLFRSAARSFGPRVVGVILTGALDDGTAGLEAVKMRGGLAVAQTPEDCVYPGMPSSAIENVGVDHIVPLAEMAAFLARIVMEPANATAWEPPPDAAKDSNPSLEVLSATPDATAPSGFSCPDCHGALWETHESATFRFRCAVGHSFSATALVAYQSEALEESLWIAFRALQESAAMARKMAARARLRNQATSASLFTEQAEEADARAEVVRQVLATRGPPTS